MLVALATLATGCDRFWGLGDPAVGGSDASSKISFVQSQCHYYANNNMGNPFTVVLDNSTTGDLLIVSTAHAGPSSSLFVFSDDHDDSFHMEQMAPFAQESQLLSVTNIVGGPTTITATPDTGIAPIRICVAEYAGVDPINPIAMSASNRHGPGVSTPELENVELGAMTAPTGGLIAISVFNLLESDEIVATPGFTIRDTSGVDALLEDTPAGVAIDTIIATIDARMTLAGDPWAALGVAIQPPM
jgi:hypothetical protein